MYIDPENLKRHINMRPIRHLLYSFEAEHGVENLSSLLEEAGVPLEYFDKETNWISYECYVRILKKFADFTGEENIAFRYGLNTMKYLKGWGFIIKIIVTMATPSVLLKRVVQNIHRWGRGAGLVLKDLRNDSAVVEFTIDEGFTYHREIDLHVQGQLASIPTLWGLHHSEVTEVQCIGNGANSCIYKFSWKEYIRRRTGYRALSAGAILAAVLFLLYYFGLISDSFFLILILIFIPVVFLLVERIRGYKKSQFDNINNIEEQDAAILESYLTIQGLSDDLQEKADERVKSLQKVDNELFRIIEELHIKKEQVVQSGKMAAIGSLAAGMAHELNNPIGAIRNIIQDVLEESPAGDQYRKKLETAETATGRCMRIVNDLLSFSWEEKDLSISEADINCIIDETVEDAEQAIINAGIKIIKEFDRGIPRINIDARQIRQVFMNIIMNAAQAIKDTGHIIIKTYCNGREVAVQISDTGEGIDNNIIDRIFDPFFSTKEQDRNMGMGLAISSNIIKRMDGDIRVSSVKGEGTTFFISLPVKR